MFSAALLDVESAEYNALGTNGDPNYFIYINTMKDTSIELRALYDTVEEKLVLLEKQFDKHQRAQDLARLGALASQPAHSIAEPTDPERKVKLVDKLLPQLKLSRELSHLQLDKFVI